MSHITLVARAAVCLKSIHCQLDKHHWAQSRLRGCTSSVRDVLLEDKVTTESTHDTIQPSI
jgi:hypothetical protein